MKKKFNIVKLLVAVFWLVIISIVLWKAASFVESGNIIPSKNTDIVVYRYSTDLLFDGDVINLDNKTITNYTKYSDIDNYDYTNIATQEVKEMTGLYSTNLDDVINVDENKAVIYLKHTINKSGVIKKTELCSINSFGTLCRVYEDTFKEDIN